MHRPRVIFIVGPTAIGKTRIAAKLAASIRGEVISSDSMQVYKGMGILSQAPDKSRMKKARHHLAGIISPSKEYSAALFIKKAADIIDAVIRRKKIPIVAGGSGLYIKTLIDGLFPSPEADLKFRARMQKYVSTHGAGKLHERLAKIDAAAAGRIHPNDARRIIRALEIYHTTGRTMTELKAKTKGLNERYDIKIFGLTRPREEIYSNIESRIDEMFEKGVVEEVEKLRHKKLSKTAKAVLGYKEILGYLDGRYDLDTAVSIMKMNTRRFAKRQLTWFRADERIKWYDLSKISEKDVVKFVCDAVGEV